jgi:amidase
MNEDMPTRREALQGLAAASLCAGALEAQAGGSSLCFLSAVEMARLIRTKKLSAREALAAHLQQIERVNPEGQCHGDACAGTGCRRGGEGR